MILYPRENRLLDGQNMGLYEAYAKNRVLFLNGPIASNYATMSTIVIADTMMALSMQSDDPIWLFIDTPGGSVDAGFTLYDMMEAIPAPVHTVGRRAYSMGAILLAAGAPGERYMMQHAKAMIHQPSGGSQGDYDEQKIAFEEHERVMNILITTIALHTGKEEDTIRDDIKNEHWMDAKESIDYGIADKVFDRSLIKQFKSAHAM